MDNQSQLQPPLDAFIEPMLKLRDYYGSEVEKFELLHRQALENLNHVEALLSIWPSSTNTTTSLPSASNQQNSPLSQTENISDQLNTTQSLTEVNQYEATNFVVENLVTTNDDDNHHQLSLNFATNSDSLAPQTQDLSITNTDTQQRTPALETEGNLLGYAEIPMLPEYQHLNRTQAIQKLLQEHLGTFCYIDFIILKLYGDLDADRFKIVKDKVRSSLNFGVAINRWYADPEHLACYTIDLNLIRPDGGNSQLKIKKRPPKPPKPQPIVVPMVAEFKGQLLIDALTYFFEDNPGLVFNVAEIIQAIYGELEPDQLREIKPRVLGRLSRGHRTRRFSRVPNETGLYTWDVNLLQQKDSK